MSSLLSKIGLALIAVFVVGLAGIGATATADETTGGTSPAPTTTCPDGNPWHDCHPLADGNPWHD